MKKITLLFFMLFFCILGHSQENFDDPTVTVPVTPGPWVLPSGTWQIYDNGIGSVNWTLSNGTFPANSGTQAAFINRQNIGAGNTSRDYLVSPLITTPANPQLLFNSRTTIAGSQNTTYEVRAALGSSNPLDPASFTIVLGSWADDVLNTNFDQYEEKIININPATVGTSFYVAFVKVTTQNTGALTGDRWLVDDIRVIEKCQDADVASLTATTLSTTATLTWDGTGNNQWEVHVLAQGDTFNPNAGTPITVTGTPSTTVSATTQPTATPLTPLTTYVFYVRSVCDFSNGEWVGPSDPFTTQALPPECGGNYVDSGGPSGNYSSGENNTITICPDNPGDLVTVTFTAFQTENSFDALYVFDGNSTSAPQIASTNGPGNVPGGLAGGYWGSAIPGPFTSSSADGCLTFQFRSDGSVQQAGWQANVTCGPPPTCPKPTALVVSNVNATSATLTWTNVGPGTSWEVIALPCGSPAPDASTTGIPATSPYNFTDLNSAQCYNFYVRANCESTSNGVSDWSNPATATTLIAPPVCGGTFVDEGGANNYNAGSNLTWVICPQTPGDIVTVTFTSFQTEATFDGLYVFNGNSTSAPQIASTNGGGNVPGGVPGSYWGNAIPGPFESSSADGCLTFQFRSDGSVQLSGWVANVTCGPPPTCPKPTGLTATNPTSESVVVTWASPGPATEWQILALPCGSPAPDASTTGWLTGTSPFTYPDLQSSTCYDFYVRSNCDSTNNGLSTWAGPASATTMVAPPECGGIFVDEGGPAAYQAGANTVWTICPDNPGDLVTVTFTAFQTENTFDALYVFDGNSTSAPQIASTNGPGNVPGGLAGGFWGNAIPGPFESSSSDGCLTFWFRSDGSVQQQGWTANVTCNPPPTCVKPNDLTATNITPVSASLSWNQPANAEGFVATNWEILVLPLGSAPPTTAGIPTTLPYQATGLQPASCYTYYVRAICSSTDSSAWAGPFNFCTTPLNDECTSAVTVPVNQDLLCVQSISGSLAGATASSQASSCAAAANDDVWYQFTATADTHIISFSNITPNTGLAFGIFQGTDCGSMTEVNCTQDDNLIADMLVPGQHYFIRVFSTATQPQTSTFNLCIGTVPCSEAPSFCSTQPVTYQNATNVPQLGQIGCLFTTPNPAFFFLQVNQAGPLNYLITQSTSPGGGPNLDVDYVVWGPFPDNATACAAVPANPLPQGTCPNLHACSYSAAPTETMCLPNAQLCEVYVVMITNFANQPGYVTFTQTNTNVPGGGTTECYPDTTFNYDQVAYCQNDNDPTPVLADGAISGAVYTSTPGLVIDSATGTIDLSASTPGTYIVTSTYSISGEVTCVNFQTIVRTRTVVITPVPDAAISYTQPSYCVSDGVQTVNQTGTIGGTYSATPNGLFLDPISGTIVPNASAPGVYTITYTIPAAGGCDTFTTPTQVEILAAPNVTAPSDVTACDEYDLPVLTTGNYYSEPNGQGTIVTGPIQSTQTIYVYASNGICTDEDSFVVTINETPDLSGTSTEASACSSYTVPTPAIGHYYASTGGAGAVLDGTVITSSTVIYLYAAEGTCSSEVAVNVTIGNLVLPDPADVSVCDQYELPVLALGDYYPAAGGNGTPIPDGTIIDQSQTIYVYAADGDCSAEQSFTVTILETPALGELDDVNACSSFTLTTPAVGDYFDAPGGVGNNINNTTISTLGTTTVYVYASNGTCSAEDSFTVTIGNIVADELSDVTRCDCYTLPALSANNSYHTAPNGGGSVLNAGECVSTTQTIYIWASLDSCTDESDFDVTINTTPVVAENQDVEACDSYTLPALTVGSYYSQPGGVDPITDLTLGVGSHTVYVYASTGVAPDLCTDEDEFVVNVTASPTADVPGDATVCSGSCYTLPSLAAGSEYWTGAGGTGTQLNAGDQICQTQQVYVHAPAANPACSDDGSFTVTVSDAPVSTIEGGCQGNAYVLEATAVNYDPSQATYSWSVSSGEGQVVSGGSTASATVSGAGTYTLTVTVAGCEGQAPFVAASTSCTIQKGISANGDGANDFFDLEGFNVRRLEIYNRYGMKVYERANYTNQWRGQSDKGDELPDGTYYYVIERNDGEPTKTGWIYINRKN